MASIELAFLPLTVRLLTCSKSRNERAWTWVFIRPHNERDSRHQACSPGSVSFIVRALFPLYSFPKILTRWQHLHTLSRELNYNLPFVCLTLPELIKFWTRRCSLNLLIDARQYWRSQLLNERQIWIFSGAPPIGGETQQKKINGIQEVIDCQFS
jgi:hypothetical protein